MSKKPSIQSNTRIDKVKMVQLSCSFATNCRTKCYFSRAGQGRQQLIPLNSWVYSFSQKAENYLLDVCWTREETSKATASNVISQISREFKRRHQSEMLSKTDRLIQQQIARYFSRLSAVTKIGLLMRSPSVNMNEDGEADANDLASEFETDRTRQKIRRDLAKFRQRLQERVQLLLS